MLKKTTQSSPFPPPPTSRILPAPPQVIGTEFYVMEFAEGRIFLDPNLPELTPQQRTHV